LFIYGMDFSFTVMAMREGKEVTEVMELESEVK
jgi:hypothetical protein